MNSDDDVRQKTTSTYGMSDDVTSLVLPVDVPQALIDRYGSAGAAVDHAIARLAAEVDDE